MVHHLGEQTMTVLPMLCKFREGVCHSCWYRSDLCEYGGRLRCSLCVPSIRCLKMCGSSPYSVLFSLTIATP